MAMFLVVGFHFRHSLCNDVLVLQDDSRCMYLSKAANPLTPSQRGARESHTCLSHDQGHLEFMNILWAFADQQDAAGDPGILMIANDSPSSEPEYDQIWSLCTCRKCRR